MNETILSGIISTPQIDHCSIYSATLTVVRASGVSDHIPLLIPQFLLPQTTNVYVKGEFRSHNTPERHLRLYVYAQEISPCDILGLNQTTLQGYVCKPVSSRRTPKGRIISDVLLAIPRSNMPDRSDYIPLIIWKDVSDLSVGDCISVQGRLQSRNYVNGVAYELSVTKFI